MVFVYESGIRCRDVYMSSDMQCLDSDILRIGMVWVVGNKTK